MLSQKGLNLHTGPTGASSSRAQAHGNKDNGRGQWISEGSLSSQTQ